VTVGFEIGGTEFLFRMLVDSGADNIVLPLELMEGVVEPADCALVSGNTYFGRAEGLVSAFSELLGRPSLPGAGGLLRRTIGSSLRTARPNRPWTT
jgi:hypothetical protein